MPDPDQQGEVEKDPFKELTADEDSAHLLRENLTVISEQYRDSHLGQLVAQVLNGQGPLRDLEVDPDFMHLTQSGVRQYRQYLASLDQDQRDQLIEQANDLPTRTRTTSKGSVGEK